VVSTEHRRRTLAVISIFAGGLVVVAFLVLVIFSYGPLNSARDDLNQARTIISNDLANRSLFTSADGRARLANDIGSVAKEAAEANTTLSNSESISLLGHLPVLGAQRDGVLQLAMDVEKATTTGQSILGALNKLAESSHGTTVGLPALASLEFSVVADRKGMAALDRPTSGLIGPIASARRDFDREDAKLVRLLSLTAKTIDFARPFLGANGPQTYLIAGQNNAEMRDSGAVLSLDLLTAQDGTFSLDHATTYGNYILSSPANFTLPPGTQQIFGAYKSTEEWPEVDATADFATTGQDMQAMWAQATGQTVNGVIGIDVPGVASILRLTGPVMVPGIDQPVSATNVADVLLNEEYAGDTVNNPQNTRRDKISAVVKAAIDEMKKERIDLGSFANALANDVQGRHLMVWSAAPADEAGLRTLDAAGTLTTSEPDRTIHLAVENNTADKLDYFLRVGVAMKVTVDNTGNAIINTTIRVANGALPNQPPSYQYGPDGVNAFTPGQYVARVFYWGPVGAQVPGSVNESGLQVVENHFSLMPTQHGQVTFTTIIPHAVRHGRLQLRLIPQARLVPDKFSLSLEAPSWKVSGRTHISTRWGKTLTLSWGLSH
jgi:hypothetical protein